MELELELELEPEPEPEPEPEQPLWSGSGFDQKRAAPAPQQSSSVQDKYNFAISAVWSEDNIFSFALLQFCKPYLTA